MSAVSGGVLTMYGLITFAVFDPRWAMEPRIPKPPPVAKVKASETTSKVRR